MSDVAQVFIIIQSQSYVYPRLVLNHDFSPASSMELKKFPTFLSMSPTGHSVIMGSIKKDNQFGRTVWVELLQTCINKTLIIILINLLWNSALPLNYYLFMKVNKYNLKILSFMVWINQPNKQRLLLLITIYICR